MNDRIYDLAVELGNLLKKNGWSVTTAESCTAGGIASAITDVPGSSEWFEQGFITYSNAVKSTQLGVSPEILDSEGAVSQQVVDAMAQGALVESKANIAVAVSGVAGPGGGSPAKPVGTVWIAWHTAECAYHKKFLFPGDRISIRQEAIKEALVGLISLIKETTV